ncbi:MAG: tRNA pseudouridine(38-40) synthase TruA [Candidatus Hydrothermarchaeales archaeon]
MRYALKIYYDGRGFHGSQIQPDVRTVEGEFFGALKELKIEFDDFRSAGRTDRGVSAIGNVFAMTTDSKIVEPRILNSKLPHDLRILAVREVEDNFDPRKEALERVYRYFLFDEGYDLRKMKRAIKSFEGEHDFHNFAVLEGRNPVRRLNKIGLDRDGEITILTFFGESFLWQMVRRIVTALKMVGRGELQIGEIERYFDPNFEKKVPPSNPENLVLWEVRYDFEFEEEGYSIEDLISALNEDLKGLKVGVKMKEEISTRLSEE